MKVKVYIYYMKSLFSYKYINKYFNISSNVTFFTLNADVLSYILKYLDTKSVKNLFYSTGKYRFSTDKRIVDIFMDHLIYNIQNDFVLKTIIKDQFLVNIKNVCIKYILPKKTSLNLPNIKRLILSCNKKIINFSPYIHLTHIDFGNDFNCDLGNSLHGHKLVYIKFGDSFNRLLHYYRKIELENGRFYSKKVSCFDGLPLKYLQFGKEFTRNIDDDLKDLPLKILILYNILNNNILDNLVNSHLVSLTELYLINLSVPLLDNLKGLPLEKLYIGSYKNNLYYVKDNRYFSCLEGLPLKILKILSFNKSLNYNDNGIRKSCLKGSRCRLAHSRLIPLEELYIGEHFDDQLYDALHGLPLKKLYLGIHFEQNLYYESNGQIISCLKGLPLEKLELCTWRYNYFFSDNKLCLDNLSLKHLKIKNLCSIYRANLLTNLSIECLDLSDSYLLCCTEVFDFFLPICNIKLKQFILPNNCNVAISYKFKNIAKQYDKNQILVNYTRFDHYELKYINLAIKKIYVIFFLLLNLFFIFCYVLYLLLKK